MGNERNSKFNELQDLIGTTCEGFKNNTNKIKSLTSSVCNNLVSIYNKDTIRCYNEDIIN